MSRPLEFSDINTFLDCITSKFNSQTIRGSELLEKWIEIFGQKEVKSQDLNRFFTYLWGDPFIAWTAANVLKRDFIQIDFFEKLVELYDVLYNVCEGCPKTISTRWRIVHILGKCRKEENITFLKKVVFDKSEHKNIRFGAARSLIEVVSIIDDIELRQKILAELSDRISEIDKKRVIQELRRAALHRDPNHIPENWTTDYMPLLVAGKEYFQKLNDMAELGKWNLQSEKLAERESVSHP